MAFVFQVSEQRMHRVMIQIAQKSSWRKKCSPLPALNAANQKQPLFHTVSALFIPFTTFETVFLDLLFSSHLTHLSPASQTTAASFTLRQLPLKLSS